MQDRFLFLAAVPGVKLPAQTCSTCSPGPSRMHRPAGEFRPKYLKRRAGFKTPRWHLLRFWQTYAPVCSLEGTRMQISNCCFMVSNLRDFWNELSQCLVFVSVNFASLETATFHKLFDSFKFWKRFPCGSWPSLPLLLSKAKIIGCLERCK